jgi:AcrR family transcriptional regulator
MPRPLREQSILAVAGQVFAQTGYEGASMDRIATLAGVSKPMLYAYFGSKEGLYVAYVERTGGELVQRLVGVDGTEPRARLRAVISEFLAFVEEHRDGWTVLYHELNNRRPLAEQVAQLRSRIVTEVQGMLSGAGAGTGRPGLVGPASEGVAVAIVGAGESLANWWLTRSDVAREDVVDWYVGLTRAAISAATRRDS